MSMGPKQRVAGAVWEQPDAELVLQAPDVLGHGRLGQEKRLGGAGERAELGDLGEDLELAQIHAAEYRSAPGPCPADDAGGGKQKGPRRAR